jgi:hypothetical protein
MPGVFDGRGKYVFNFNSAEELIGTTLPSLFFAGAVYRYSKGGAYGQFVYAGFGALMCSRIMRTLEVFVTHVRLTSDPTIAEIQGLTAQPTSTSDRWMATLT